MTNFLPFSDMLLMSPPAGAGGQQTDPIMQFLPLVLIVAVFWFFIIRPQKKRQKERQELVNKMDKGDKVVTSSGIHGKVVALEDSTILVEVAENVKLRFEKSAVTTVTPKNA
jgi:preprotein translocase subunit YajC